MELYNVPYGSKIRVQEDTQVPVGAPAIEKHEVLVFKGIDGMYSKCIKMNGEVTHLVAWADVEIVE